MKILIIGSGMAAHILAAEIRKYDNDCSITIITSDLGYYYSKPMLSMAMRQHKDIESLKISSATEVAKKYNLTILEHKEVTSIDHANKKVIASNESYTYDKCVMACGSSAIKLRLNDLQEESFFSINSLHEYETFKKNIGSKKKISIIGAGLVGVEFAHDLNSAGYEVSLICYSSYHLATMLPKVVGELLAKSMRDIGIEMCLDEKVKAITNVEDHYEISCHSGLTIHPQLILSAVGIRANISIAQESNILCNQGVLTDQYCMTSVDDVYALGDCAEVKGLNLHYVPPIRKCAAALAKTLTGSPTEVCYEAMPVTVKSSSCPLVICIPRVDLSLDMEVNGSSKNMTIKYFGKNDRTLYGFILTGDCVKDKISLQKQIPNWMGSNYLES